MQINNVGSETDNQATTPLALLSKQGVSPYSATLREHMGG